MNEIFKETDFSANFYKHLNVLFQDKFFWRKYLWL